MGLRRTAYPPSVMVAAASGSTPGSKTFCLNTSLFLYLSLKHNKAGENTQQTPQEKAKRRRSQIRKAQIQHRERKEGYIKELELDVTQTKGATEQVERECEGIRRENAVIRAMLGKLERFPALPSLTEIQVTVHERLFWYQIGHLENTWQLGQGGTASPGQVNSLTVEKAVTMSMDDTMKQPCYRILPSSPSTEGQSLELSTDEEDFAINFILAYAFKITRASAMSNSVNKWNRLEHICWDHFHPHDFHPPNSDAPGTETGHALMASTICASNAQETTHISLGEDHSILKAPSQTWQASGLTLQNLRLLASSLTPDDAEITPVQGWFELAERYGSSVLLNREVVEALKREFVGVVKCLHFGAIIERDSFESVVERVVGEYTPGLFMQ